MLHRSTISTYQGLLFGMLLIFGTQLQAQTQPPQQVLSAMEKCRLQVISQLSFGDKMKMKAVLAMNSQWKNK
jgi:hypothetical protein